MESTVSSGIQIKSNGFLVLPTLFAPLLYPLQPPLWGRYCLSFSDENNVDTLRVFASWAFGLIKHKSAVMWHHPRISFRRRLRRWLRCQLQMRRQRRQRCLDLKLIDWLISWILMLFEEPNRDASPEQRYPLINVYMWLTSPKVPHTLFSYSVIICANKVVSWVSIRWPIWWINWQSQWISHWGWSREMIRQSAYCESVRSFVPLRGH